jgi:transposase-like protein
VVDISQERIFTMVRSFSPECKDEAVRLVITTGRAVATVAHELVSTRQVWAAG